MTQTRFSALAVVWLIFTLSNSVHASGCKASDAAAGKWAFTLAGPAILSESGGGSTFLTEDNGEQLNLAGTLTFNSQSSLTRGNAGDLTELLLESAGVVEFDEDTYNGYVVDKKTQAFSSSGRPFTKFKKKLNACTFDGKVAFKGLDFIGGSRFSLAYCYLTARLDQTALAGLIAGYCVTKKLYNGVEFTSFSVVDGTMIKK